MERPYRFEVLTPFAAEVNGHVNLYQPGLPYRVRVGDTWDDLHRLFQTEWLPRGLVRVIE